MSFPQPQPPGMSAHTSLSFRQTPSALQQTSPLTLAVWPVSTLSTDPYSRPAAGRQTQHFSPLSRRKRSDFEAIVATAATGRPSIAYPVSRHPSFLSVVETMVQVCAAVGLLACCLLILGLCLDQKYFLLPWIIDTSVFIVVDFVYVMGSIINAHVNLEYDPETHSDIEFSMLHTVVFFSLALNVYAVLCVTAQFQEYMAGGGTAQARELPVRTSSVRFARKSSTHVLATCREDVELVEAGVHCSNSTRSERRTREPKVPQLPRRTVSFHRHPSDKRVHRIARKYSAVSAAGLAIQNELPTIHDNDMSNNTCNGAAPDEGSGGAMNFIAGYFNASEPTGSSVLSSSSCELDGPSVDNNAISIDMRSSDDMLAGSGKTSSCNTEVIMNIEVLHDSTKQPKLPRPVGLKRQNTLPITHRDRDALNFPVSTHTPNIRDSLCSPPMRRGSQFYYSNTQPLPVFTNLLSNSPQLASMTPEHAVPLQLLTDASELLDPPHRSLQLLTGPSEHLKLMENSSKHLPRLTDFPEPSTMLGNRSEPQPSSVCIIEPVSLPSFSYLSEPALRLPEPYVPVQMSQLESDPTECLLSLVTASQPNVPVLLDPSQSNYPNMSQFISILSESSPLLSDQSRATNFSSDPAESVPQFHNNYRPATLSAISSHGLQSPRSSTSNLSTEAIGGVQEGRHQHSNDRQCLDSGNDLVENHRLCEVSNNFALPREIEKVRINANLDIV
ncbi:uncharacterized protein LOC125178327 [Hyalella azteca]|uniref:Uncharacterized protein LOC125178327 n=1 Tax=Hyalella azteca TaxID=294128 RepID=A0A979FL85_HYAAZ|nr:uncharacterized protein LOC125178327 [Hyalella azteca]